MTFKVPERFRMQDGVLASDKSFGNNGVFVIGDLGIIVSDEVWEHVSVSLIDRCPTWNEMSFIKGLFWDEDDFVVQMHPPKEDYVNYHPYCLHLWRKAGTNDFCERPPSIMVGYK